MKHFILFILLLAITAVAGAQQTGDSIVIYQGVFGPCKVVGCKYFTDQEYCGVHKNRRRGDTFVPCSVPTCWLSERCGVHGWRNIKPNNRIPFHINPLPKPLPKP